MRINVRQPASQLSPPVIHGLLISHLLLVDYFYAAARLSTRLPYQHGNHPVGLAPLLRVRLLILPRYLPPSPYATASFCCCCHCWLAASSLPLEQHNRRSRPPAEDFRPARRMRGRVRLYQVLISIIGILLLFFPLLLRCSNLLLYYVNDFTTRPTHKMIGVAPSLHHHQQHHKPHRPPSPIPLTQNTTKMFHLSVTSASS